MEGAYPWGLIKHGESSCCLNSEGKEILHRLWGIFSTLCTCHHTLVFTWWLLTDCWQSCLEKWSASGTGPQTRFAWTENASELPGRVLSRECLGRHQQWFWLMSPYLVQPDAPTPKNGPRTPLIQNHPGCLLNLGIPGPQPRPMESEFRAVGPWNPTVLKKVLADCGKSIWGSRM